MEFVLNKIQPDIVQAPFNIIDKRIQTSGWLDKLYDQGVEIHCRSVFLQGLLLIPREKIPSKFKPWIGLLNRWHDWLEHHSIEPYKACLHSINTHQIERLVVGIDNYQQCQDLINASNETVNVDSYPDITSNDAKLINPSFWQSL